MRKPFRLLALAGAAVASLALASGALATPRLAISPNVIQATWDKSDAAPLKDTIYVPSGYSVTLNQAAGTQIGTVHADLQALAISPDAIIQAEGTILTDDPAKHTGPSDIACAGAGPHAAVLLLHVVVSGQTLDVPSYVDAPLAGAEAALGSAKLTFCLSDPYDNAGAARAPFGVKVINAKLTFNPGIINAPASGELHWTSLITPWNTAAPAPNAAGTVEARGFVLVPSSLSLKATVKTVRHKHGKKTTVTNSVLLSGTLLEALQGVSGATVDIFAGGKKRGSTTTDASGKYSRRLGLPNKTSFQATATVPQRDITSTGCAGPSPAPGGCVSATLAGYAISSPTVSATPKKK